MHLHPDRLFPIDGATRHIAKRLYESVKKLPIISPHGHTDPAWFALNEPFENATSLLITPDHYVFRMLYSQGVPLTELGIKGNQGKLKESDPRKIWRTFAEYFYLFQGTPSRIWFEDALEGIFGITERLNVENCDAVYEEIQRQLEQPECLPRSLFDQFNIEFLATTESPLDPLAHHDTIRSSGWSGRVVTTYRPDSIIDPEFEDFQNNLKQFANITGEDTFSYAGYLNAHRKQREAFRARGATATDHGHPTAGTASLRPDEAAALFKRVTGNNVPSSDAELFRRHMLTEMAKMSLQDGMVMQIHPGSYRNHNQWLFDQYGRDKGADIPMQTDYVSALKPMLDVVGNEASLTIILFTLDETAYSRELAPLAGHYPSLKLGPPWWFFDSPEGILRYKRSVVETAGFYNIAGFNDDTRAFLSIPARHDMSRRMDCRFLAELVAEHRLDESEAYELAKQLAYQLAKDSYKI